MLNLNDQLTLRENQIPDIAIMLLEEYSHDSLEDIVLALRNGVLGNYGKIFRFDVAVVFEWMRLFLSDKAEARERQLKTTQKAEVEKEMTQEELDKWNKKVVEILNDPNSWTSKMPTNNDEEFRKFKTDYAIKKTLNEKANHKQPEQSEGA